MGPAHPAISSSEPYLSFVVTTRNDDHGGDALGRTQIFLDGFLEQVERFGLRAELIIVEWNPPPDRPPLSEALRWSRFARPGLVRIIRVPPEIHRRYKHGDRLGLFQMIAKNAGIRRARGRFILCTNIDLLFSDELMRFLSAERLDPARMYRVDRIDVAPDIPPGLPVALQLDWCRWHILRVNTRWGTFAPGERWWLQGPRRKYRQIIREPLSRWARRSVAVLQGLGFWVERLPLLVRRIRVPRVRRPDRLTWPKFRKWVGRVWDQFLGRLKQIRPPARASIDSLVRRFSRTAIAWKTRAAQMRLEIIWPLHTNGCGDFTLLAREHWAALRGYPEWDMFSIHLDSVLCQMAHHAGARETVLKGPMRAYHVEHRSGWIPNEPERLIQRMQTMGVPCLQMPVYRELVFEMRRRRGPLLVNDENWGLATDHLEELDPLARQQFPGTSLREQAIR